MSCKNFCLKTLGMLVNVSRWDTAKTAMIWIRTVLAYAMRKLRRRITGD